MTKSNAEVGMIETSAPSGVLKAGRAAAEHKLAELRHRLAEIGDLGSAGALLGWDQATYMPRRGISARSRQGALLHRLAHEKATDPALGRLLDELAPYADRLPYDSDTASLIRVARRDFDRAIRVPADYVERANAHGSAAFDAWTRARPANDFAAMVGFLQTGLDLSREYADFFTPYGHVADPLIDDADQGMTTASIRRLFAELKGELVVLAPALSAQAPVDDRCLRGRFDRAAQLDFNRSVAAQMGYDFASAETVSLQRVRPEAWGHPVQDLVADSRARPSPRRAGADGGPSGEGTGRTGEVGRGGPLARAGTEAVRSVERGTGRQAETGPLDTDAALSLIAGLPIRLVVRRREFHEPVEMGDRQAYPHGD